MERDICKFITPTERIWTLTIGRVTELTIGRIRARSDSGLCPKRLDLEVQPAAIDNSQYGRQVQALHLSATRGPASRARPASDLQVRAVHTSGPRSWFQISRPPSIRKHAKSWYLHGQRSYWIGSLPADILVDRKEKFWSLADLTSGTVKAGRKSQDFTPAMTN